MKFEPGEDYLLGDVIAAYLRAEISEAIETIQEKLNMTGVMLKFVSDEEVAEEDIDILFINEEDE